MYLLAIKNFRELAVTLIGDLSPNMSFLYDIVAVVFAFLFIIVIYSFFIFVRNEVRKLR